MRFIVNTRIESRAGLEKHGLKKPRDQQSERGATDMLPLFERYPLLKEKLPYVSLGEFPTPVEKLERLGQAINAPYLFAKREDLIGRLYGGNKIRALEFLLGDALVGEFRRRFGGTSS